MRPVALLSLLALACSTEEPATKGGDGSDGAPLDDTNATVDDTNVDTGDTAAPVVDPCEVLGLPVRAFDATAPSAFQRHQPAGDFSVPLVDGTTWTLSEQWSGCEVYAFVPNWFAISSLDNRSFWETDLDDLIDESPKNVHYFFVVGQGVFASAEEEEAAMAARVDAALLALDEEDRAWWSDRLHVVHGTPLDFSGLVSDMFMSEVGTFGWSIDREQKIRGMGYMADVTAYDRDLAAAGEWPYEMRLFPIVHEAEYLNFEAERAARLDAEGATLVPVFGGDVVAEYVDGTATLPDAATMATFDTLEIEVIMECPNKDSYEINNCGAWDYLAYLWLYDAPTESYLEMGRFITSYHRENHWVVDATHALAWLQAGGEVPLRFLWAPPWNTQPTGVTLQLRLSNQGKGMAPREAIPLFTGGAFNIAYNDRTPIEVAIPDDAAKVELRAIITGHGMAEQNCAEFCKHGHHFTVGTETASLEFDEAGTNRGCERSANSGTIPNQAGTWWYGRGGWCPGREVAPFVYDFTAQAPAGSTASFSYQATLNGGDLIDGAGDIALSSWAVIYK